jgi:hypothetical protein
MRSARFGPPFAMSAALIMGSAPAVPPPTTIPPAPAAFRFDGRATEWLGVPPTLALLPQGTGAPGGRLWLGTADSGLVVAGSVPGASPRWPDAADRMAAGDHVEVWLVDGDTLVLPPIGWGNQFDDLTLASPDDCASRGSGDSTAVAACREWYAAQQRYRRTFRRLFVRQWQLAPNLAVETFATPAYDAFDADTRPYVEALRPTATPTMRATPTTGGEGYEFEVLIPWSAFPPLRSLEVERLRLMVDVFRPGTGGRRSGPFATTAPARRWGDVTTFNPVSFAAPRRYAVTSCAYPLHGYRAPDARYFGYSRIRMPDTIPTYFLPATAQDVRAVIGLENEAHGYAYEPAGHSPIATVTSYFTRPVGEGGLVCGPPLRYHDGGGAIVADSITLDSTVQVQALPDGTFLLRNGPQVFYSYYGSGQCGACPRVGLTMLHLDPRGDVTPALEYVGIADLGSTDIDVAVSNAWDSVTVWDQTLVGDDYHPVWSQTTYCWDRRSRTYPVCVKRDSVPEPSPRHIVWDQ